MRRHILLLDSGAGGIATAATVRDANPDAAITCVADYGFYPYGLRSDAVLTEHLLGLLDGLLPVLRPDLLVIACNTASTVALDALRARFAALPIVGCVPPVRLAAGLSRTRVIGLLATPATVGRDYVRALRDTHAPDCLLIAHGARDLADLAEAAFAGRAPDRAVLATELDRLFGRDHGDRIDAVCLGCTHYGLLQPALAAAAPRPVAWLDPAGGVARRTAALLGVAPDGSPHAPARAAPGGRLEAAAPGRHLVLVTGPPHDPEGWARGAARHGFERLGVWDSGAITPWRAVSSSVGAEA